MVAPLWDCVQSLLSEVEDLKKEVKQLKGKGKGDGKQYKKIYTVGSKSSKPTDTDYMKQIKDLDISKQIFHCLIVLKNVLVVQKNQKKQKAISEFINFLL